MLIVRRSGLIGGLIFFLIALQFAPLEGLNQQG